MGIWDTFLDKGPYLISLIIYCTKYLLMNWKWQHKSVYLYLLQHKFSFHFYYTVKSYKPERERLRDRFQIRNKSLITVSNPEVI